MRRARGAGQRSRQPRGGARHAGGNEAQAIEQRRRPMTPLTAVRLVSALAGEHHLHPLSGEAEAAGGRRRSGCRRAPRAAAWNPPAPRGSPLGHGRLVVIGADQPCALGWEPRSSSTSPWPGKPIVKVVGVLGRAAMEATTAAPSTPTREKGAVGDIGHHLAFHRVAEALGELGGELVVASVALEGSRRLAPASEHAVRRPPPPGWRPAAASDTLEQCPGGGHEAAGEVVVEGDPVHLGWHEPGGHQGADLRREPHAAPVRCTSRAASRRTRHGRRPAAPRGRPRGRRRRCR